MEYLLLGSIAANAALTLYSLHKIRRVHLATFDLRAEFARLHSHYLVEFHQQLQELARLHFALQLDEPLPATRGWAASPDFLRLLADHVRTEKPKTVVELGSGTSTIVLARALQLNGEGNLFSFDHDPDFAAQTRRNLQRYGLSEFATVVDAALEPTMIDGRSWRWYNIGKWFDRAIDLLVIDGPPEPTGPLARYPAGPILFPKLAENATVFLDDADRPDERKILEQWQTQFPFFSVARPHTEKGCAILRRRKANSLRTAETLSQRASV